MAKSSKGGFIKKQGSGSGDKASANDPTYPSMPASKKKGGTKRYGPSVGKGK